MQDPGRWQKNLRESGAIELTDCPRSWSCTCP